MRRTMLFLPGNNPNMLQNGDILGADCVIFDLEDAVSPAEKDSARILVRNMLKSLPFQSCQVIVRINSLDTPFWLEDIGEMVALAQPLLMPTKVSDKTYIQTISEAIAHEEEKNGLPVGSTKLMPLLETALGIENAYEIASADKRVVALFLGAEDLTADLHCRRTGEGEEIAYARARIVCAARAAGLEVYDTPFTSIDDMEGLKADALRAKAMGFDGKAVISPRHVDCVNKIFSPTMQEVQYAKRVFEAIDLAKQQGKGAVSLGGKMIDAPIVKRAQQVLEAAKMMGVGELNE